MKSYLAVLIVLPFLSLPALARDLSCSGEGYTVDVQLKNRTIAINNAKPIGVTYKKGDGGYQLEHLISPTRGIYFYNIGGRVFTLFYQNRVIDLQCI